jgi:hypothetical protein
MSKYSTIVDTEEGQAIVSTSPRWMAFVAMPHTTVMPHPCTASELKRFGTVIKWTTDDPALLQTLHEAIVRLVREVGAPGMVEIAKSAKATEQIWKAFGGVGQGLQQVAEMASQEGAPFPMPAEVLKYVKGFQ